MDAEEAGEEIIELDEEDEHDTPDNEEGSAFDSQSNASKSSKSGEIPNRTGRATRSPFFFWNFLDHDTRRHPEDAQFSVGSITTQILMDSYEHSTYYKESG